MAGKKGQIAVGNLKNGASQHVSRLTVGDLPKELMSVRREGRSYRRALESALVAMKGEVSVIDAHHVDTASAATIQAGICRWVMRNKFKTMSTSDILACSREQTKAKQARDAAVKALGLDVKPEPETLAKYIVKANGAAK